MISKKLSFVVDTKGNDIMAPQFVPSHSSVLRQYQVLAERSGDDEPMFARFPEDYVLVTVDFSSDGDVCVVGDISSTRFTDFIGKE